MRTESGVTLFAINRSLDEPMPLEVTATGFGSLRLHEALQLHHADLTAVNTKQDPDRVRPAPLANARVSGEHVSATLSPASWTMLRLVAAS